MANTKSAKRALVAGILALAVCVSMLVGTTFAWFTDSATTGVNTIVSGNLDIGLEMLVDGEWIDAEGQSLGFVDDEGNIMEDILWEPGCSYLLQPFRVVNKGDLALKFDIIVTGISGDLALAEVIEYGTYTEDGGNMQFQAMGNLLDFNSIFDSVENAGLAVLQPNESYDTASEGITFRMKETAGNEYQGLSLSGMSITVVATQLNSESDSFGSDYDANAEWPVILTADDAGVVAALAQNQDAKIILNGDVTIDNVTEIAGDKLIDLNGKTLTVSGEKGITVTGDSTLTIDNGTIAYTGADFAPIYVSDNSVINIEDGAVFDITSEAVSGQWSMATAVYVNRGSNSTVNINGGVINVTGDNATGVYANYAGGGNHTVNLNGGEINVSGKGAIGLEVLSTNTLNLNGGVINVSGEGAYAFNVGQIQGQPTVVNGNGATVINLDAGAELCDSDDMAQCEGKATVNVAGTVTIPATAEGVSIELNGAKVDNIIIPDGAKDITISGGAIAAEASGDKLIQLSGNHGTVTLTNMKLSGVANVKAGHAVSGGNGTTLVVDSCIISDIGYGLQDTFSGYDTLTVTNSTFENTVSWAILNQGATKSVTIDNCKFINCQAGILKTTGMQANGTLVFTNNTMVDCKEHDPYGLIQLGNKETCTITWSGNTFDGEEMENPFN